MSSDCATCRNREEVTISGTHVPTARVSQCRWFKEHFPRVGCDDYQPRPASEEPLEEWLEKRQQRPATPRRYRSARLNFQPAWHRGGS
ncbi:MAG: hypothetical protein JXA37_11400 [Chloroflexia bacterium]|nr:hypothetical protein [Chloroflexia bacterium]